MTGEGNQIRVGDLLMQAGILSSEFIRQSLHNFERRGLPIGKVLVMSGYLTEQQLRIALEVQSLINDGHLPLELGVEVLALAHKDKLSLSDAFQQSGLVQPEDQETNKLGQLLVSAEIVNNRELEEALQINVRTGLPLGHVFCFRGYVSQALMYTTLLVQQLVRKGVVKREEGISALRSAYRREVELERLEINKGFQRLPIKQALRLGELLVESRVLVEALLPDALTRSVLKQRPLGEELVQSRFVSQALVNAAVEMQEMMDNGTLIQTHAVEALQAIRMREISSTRALAEACTFKARHNLAVSLVDILTSSGIVAVATIPKEVQERVSLNYNQMADVAKLLIENNLVEEHVLYCAMRAVYLLDVKFLNMEQAILAVDFARKDNTTVDEVMRQMGWTARTRLKS